MSPKTLTLYYSYGDLLTQQLVEVMVYVTALGYFFYSSVLLTNGRT